MLQLFWVLPLQLVRQGRGSIQCGAHLAPLLKHLILVLCQMPSGYEVLQSGWWERKSFLALCAVCCFIYSRSSRRFIFWPQFPHTYAHLYSATLLRGTPCRLEVFPRCSSPLSGVHPVNYSHLGLPWPLALSQFSLLGSLLSSSWVSLPYGSGWTLFHSLEALSISKQERS